MRIYRGYEKYSETYALPHILANNIRCRYYGWCGMVGNIDRVKIDGRIRYFDINTHKEVQGC